MPRPETKYESPQVIHTSPSIKSRASWRHNRNNIQLYRFPQTFDLLNFSYWCDILISMNYIQTISKIRGRGQLTVPQDIRKALDWPDDEMMVKITTVSDGFRVEKLSISHPQHPQKKLTKSEWDKIYKDMEKISQSGKQNVKLTDFLRHDRDTHF